MGTFALIRLASAADTTVDRAAADPRADDLDLHVYSGFRFEAAESPFSYGDLTLHPGSTIVAGSASVTITAANVVADQATWDLSRISAPGCSANIAAPCAAAATTVTLHAGVLDLDGGDLVGDAVASWAIDVSGATTMAGGTLTGVAVDVLGDGAVDITGDAYVEARDLHIVADSLNVAASAHLSGDARGTAAG